MCTFHARWPKDTKHMQRKHFENNCFPLLLSIDFNYCLKMKPEPWRMAEKWPQFKCSVFKPIKAKNRLKNYDLDYWEIGNIDKYWTKTLSLQSIHTSTRLTMYKEGKNVSSQKSLKEKELQISKKGRYPAINSRRLLVQLIVTYYIVVLLSNKESFRCVCMDCNSLPIDFLSNLHVFYVWSPLIGSTTQGKKKNNKIIGRERGEVGKKSCKKKEGTKER